MGKEAKVRLGDFMNRVQKDFEGSNGIEEFSSRYFDYLKELFSKIDTAKIKLLVDTFEEARANGKTVFFIGNGGSAATASHFANDMGVLKNKNLKHLKAISLCENNSKITAIANDYGYEYIFEKQLESLMEKGDVLVAISASGNSANLVKAVEFVKLNGGKTFSLVGFSGGILKEISDHSLYIPTGDKEFGPVEDIHSILNHLIGSYYTYSK